MIAEEIGGFQRGGRVVETAEKRSGLWDLHRCTGSLAAVHRLKSVLPKRLRVQA